MRLSHVANNYRRRIFRAMGKSCPRFFVAGLAMNNYGVLVRPKLLGAVPYFFYKRAGGVVLLNLDPFVKQEVFNFQRGAKGWDDDHIFRHDLLPGYELASVGIHDEANSTGLEVVVHLLVMDHLAEKKHPLRRIFLQGLIADLYGVFHAVAETEMAGEVNDDRPEIQPGGCKILLSQILKPADLLDPTRQ